MKIDFVVFVYELINYEITFLLLGYVIIIYSTWFLDIRISACFWLTTYGFKEQKGTNVCMKMPF